MSAMQDYSRTTQGRGCCELFTHWSDANRRRQAKRFAKEGNRDLSKILKAQQELVKAALSTTANDAGLIAQILQAVFRRRRRTRPQWQHSAKRACTTSIWSIAAKRLPRAARLRHAESKSLG
jgi:hypothetical protein